jgi:MFS family permease
MVPVGLILLRDRPPVVTVVGGASRSIGLPDVISLSLQPALRTFAFWQLAFGFLVCGFTMAFPNTHFLAYADDMGMGHQQASFAVSVTAGFSILGSLGLGLVADRHRRASVLGLTYLLRGFAFLLLLLLPAGDLLYIYALVLGISWTATTPLTAAIATELYGPRHLGVIFGTMFMFMNLGFGVGAFLDGLIFELTGGYQFALAASAVLGFGAAIATWAVVERRPDAVGQMAAVGELERVAAPAD